MAASGQGTGSQTSWWKQKGGNRFKVKAFEFNRTNATFALPVHGVQHLNGDQHGQSHGHWVRVVEDLAVNTLELLATAQAGQMVSQLPVGQLRASLGEHEPPGGTSNGSATDISTNGHVTGKVREQKRR